VLGPTTPHQEPNDLRAFYADDEQWERLGYGPNEEPPEVAKPTERQFPPTIIEDITQEQYDRC